MLKAFGGVLVMAASFALGWSKRHALAQKADKLSLVRWEVTALKSKISGRSESLEQAFGESSFFAPAAKLIANGTPAEKAVLSLDCPAEGFGLFARGLGSETTEGQLRNIDVFLSDLDMEISRAREDLEKRGRLYLGGALLGGAAAVIMLI